jgi:hypothetical protein
LKRWTIGIAFILLLAGGGYLVHRAKEKREAAEWQAHYEKTLAAYSKGLRLGASRAEVEKYLNARKVEFTWIYAVEQPSNSYDWIPTSPLNLTPAIRTKRQVICPATV